MRIVTGHNPDWDKAFHDMVRAIVHDHLMARLAPVLDPMFATLDKIEKDVAQISQLAGRMSPVPADAERLTTSAPDSRSATIRDAR